MTECPYCKSEIDDDNPALLCEKIDEALKSMWGSFESDNDLYGYPVGKKFTIDGIGRAEVVDKKVRVDISEFATGYFDGSDELPQGTTFLTYVVLKIGETFFKKTGEGDSYSEITWAGAVKPVTPKTETRVVYTFG